MITKVFDTMDAMETAGAASDERLTCVSHSIDERQRAPGPVAHCERVPPPDPVCYFGEPTCAACLAVLAHLEP